MRPLLEKLKPLRILSSNDKIKNSIIHTPKIIIYEIFDLIKIHLYK